MWLKVGTDYGVAGFVEGAGEEEAFGHAEAGDEDCVVRRVGALAGCDGILDGL